MKWPSKEKIKEVTEMSNKNSEYQEVIATPALELTHKALAMYRDPTDTKYVLVEVSYNPADANVKVLGRDVREDIIDKFKMTVADLFFGEQ